MDKDLQAVLPLPENIVRAAAHDDAGPLVRQVQNDLALDDPQKVVGRQAVHGVAAAHARKGIGEQVFPGRSVLPLLLHKFLVKASGHGHLFDQLLVVVGHAQQLGHPLAHGAAAASELPADGDDQSIDTP